MQKKKLGNHHDVVQALPLKEKNQYSKKRINNCNNQPHCHSKTIFNKIVKYNNQASLQREMHKGKNWATTVMLGKALPLGKLRSITINRLFCTKLKDAPSSKKKLKIIGYWRKTMQPP